MTSASDHNPVVGMTKGEVLRCLGVPDQAESFPIDSCDFSVWIYRDADSGQIVWFGPDQTVRMTAQYGGASTTVVSQGNFGLDGSLSFDREPP